MYIATIDADAMNEKSSALIELVYEHFDRNSFLLVDRKV